MYSSVLGFLNIGSSEMILIVFVALFLFGGEKLPEIARGLGKGIRDFKDASDGVKREINNQINNYEEKRDEDKRVEQAIVDQQEEAKNQLPEHANGFTPVENTAPVSNPFATGEQVAVEATHTEASEAHSAAHTGPVAEHPYETTDGVTEHHSISTNIDAGTSEHTKNT